MSLCIRLTETAKSDGKSITFGGAWRRPQWRQCAIAAMALVILLRIALCFLVQYRLKRVPGGCDIIATGSEKISIIRQPRRRRSNVAKKSILYVDRNGGEATQQNDIESVPLSSLWSASAFLSLLVLGMICNARMGALKAAKATDRKLQPKQ